MSKSDRLPELMLPPGPRVDSKSVENFLSLPGAPITESLVPLAAAFRRYREGLFTESRKLLRDWTKREPDDVVAHLLLGCVYVQQQQPIRARIKFFRVLKIDPLSCEAFFNLAILAERHGELSRAAEFYRNYLSQRSDDNNVKTHLADLLLASGEIDEAANLYEQAAHGDPPSERAVNELGYSSFNRGRAAFDGGDIGTALKLWGESFAQYSAAYYRDARLVSARREFLKQLKSSGMLEQFVADYLAQAQTEKPIIAASYQLAALTFLVYGVFPECFVDIEQLDLERTRVRSLLSQEGEYAYVYYRLAVTSAYQGNFASAAAEMRVAKDLLKGKKEEMWRVSELSDFFSSIARRLEATAQYDAVRFGDEKWVDAGFRTRFESESWKRLGFAPEIAQQWRAAGFGADIALPWQKEGILPELASSWREAGFTVPRDVKRWSRGGLNAQEALRWRDVFAEDISKAIQCYRAGIVEPEEARQWLRVFELPWEAGRWKAAGFTPAEALQHRAAGISDPSLIGKR